jgi:hypothetical protein
MRTLQALIALFLLAAPLAAQDRFVDRNLNFSVLTPDAQWQWSQVQRAYLGGCEGIVVTTNPHGEQFTISVSPAGRFRLDENTLYELRSTVRRDAEASGYTIADFHHIRSTSPIFPSYTYSYTRVGKDGKVSYVDGYVAAVNRVYTIQYASNARGSIDEFKKFVSSFQIADKFEAQRSPQGPAISPFGGLPGAMKTALGQPLAPNALEPIRR